jgi:hypothetical protein
MPAVSMAAVGPAVNSESVSHVSEHAATLEAQIDPNGLETKYEFWLQYRACQSSQGPSCDAIVLAPTGEGHVGPLGTNVHVTASLTGLQAGYSYTYFVYAISDGGWTTGQSREFTAVGGGSLKTEPETLPVPENKATPYESTIDPDFGQSAAEASARQVAQHQREQEEREAKEKEATEPTRTTVAVVCRVPRLKGDSLAHARTALIRNHCKVGLVTRPRKTRGRLVVVTQGHPYGAKLPTGSAVAFRLAP